MFWGKGVGCIDFLAGFSAGGINTLAVQNDSSSYLSLSGARVSVYGGNELIKNYIVPIDVEGTNWIVFKSEDDKMIDINEIDKSVVW